VVREIEAASKRGQPVLVGTTSVESSEVLSRMLKRAGVIHTVLNAKFHQQEAEIVARAGLRGAVTIATNMAGRGTDIKLGDGVRELGGLYVIGTERHESRRIDRQLRGRCSRQGDPGLTKFFLSLEDDLMRLFLQGNLASRMMEGSMRRARSSSTPWLNRSIESAQKKVEQQNYAIRKRLLQYDDVLNQQREVVYGIRNAAIHADRPKEIIFEQVEEEVASRLAIAGFGDKGGSNAAAIGSLVGWINTHFPVGLSIEELKGDDVGALKALVVDRIRKPPMRSRSRPRCPRRSARSSATSSSTPSTTTGRSTSPRWRSCGSSIGLRSYGQKDPLVEYKSEAYNFFNELMGNVRLQICTGLFRSASNLSVLREHALDPRQERADPGPGGRWWRRSPRRPPDADQRQLAASQLVEPELQLPKVTIRRDTPKVGRNDPCPCGSGKKYKHCHGS
jgi:preprotein translocase subunit SecA